MLISRLTLFITTLVILLALWKGLNLSYVLSAIITVIIVMLGYSILALSSQKKRLRILEEELDPEAFIEAIEKQRKITGKNKRINTFLNFDVVAGLISMGRYKEAKDVMEKIDIRYLSKWSGSLLAYYNNKMLLFYNSGEKHMADEIYEKKVRDFPLKTPNLKAIMNLILASKNFEDGNYEESKELYNKYLSINNSKRLELEILYIFAEIDEKQGKIEAAMEKYSRVAKEGNKLYIVSKAREKLN